MTVPLPLVLSLALLLGAWLTWLAVRRADRRRLVARILASWVAVACLALLVSPPKITRTYSASEAILLTDGYSSDTLQALLNRLRPKPQVFSFETEAVQAEPITDFAAFKQQHPAVQTLHVLGHGLAEEELASLSSLRLVPHLSPLPAGVLSASWPKKITLGEPVQVQGIFTSPEKPVILYLQAAGGNRDSMEVKKGAGQAFQLGFTPKTSGRFVYQLQWQEGDSLRREAIPVIVEEPRLLNVLMLSSAPSFEVKFLKNALAQQGHGVAVRQEVSQNIYQTETINLSKQSLNRLTPALLQNFDVVLLEEATLQGFSAQEKQALQQAVRQQGLGILTCFSQNSAKPIPFFAEAGFRLISEKQARNAPVRWRGNASAQAVLPLPGAVLQLSQGQKPLAWGQHLQQVLVAYGRKGLGQVGVSLLPQTFSLALEGKDALYRQYWSQVLNALAKPEEGVPAPAFPSLSPQRVGQAVLFSSAIPVHSLQVGSPPSLGTVISTASSGSPRSFLHQFFPDQSGWFISPPGQDSIRPLFIHSASAWARQNIQFRHRQLLAIAQKTDTPAPTLAIPIQEEILLWPLWLALVGMLGFLWLEEKF
ncbi:hypothetical protein [Rufibacter ruber]|uniref:hypothetical protein n=1 Tax=Rufibacter ruber TaxID=1783499 RepID=UPI0008347C4E|nr:hypothetical protein [Rufibacter ruber]